MKRTRERETECHSNGSDSEGKRSTMSQLQSSRGAVKIKTLKGMQQDMKKFWTDVTIPMQDIRHLTCQYKLRHLTCQCKIRHLTYQYKIRHLTCQCKIRHLTYQYKIRHLTYHCKIRFVDKTVLICSTNTRLDT